MIPMRMRSRRRQISRMRWLNSMQFELAKLMIMIKTLNLVT